MSARVSPQHRHRFPKLYDFPQPEEVHPSSHHHYHPSSHHHRRPSSHHCTTADRSLHENQDASIYPDASQLDSGSDLLPPMQSTLLLVARAAVQPERPTTLSVTGRRNRRNKTTGSTQVSQSIDRPAWTAREVATSNFRSRATTKFL